jgi:nucleolar protein 16
MADDGEEFSGFDAETGDQKEANEIVRKLEEQASMVAEKKDRLQSDREREWIERLVAKHGEDYAKMARDMKLNPMQQTAADIRKRVAKWMANGGVLPVQA